MRRYVFYPYFGVVYQNSPNRPPLLIAADHETGQLLGRVGAGYAADLILLDEHLQVQMVFCGGELVVGKPAGKHNHGRRREEPTRTEIHRLEACPCCGGELVNHRETYRRQIIDIPEPQPIEVVEHQIEQGWCEHCRQWHTPEVKWPASVGQGRMGERLTGLVGYMRSFLRLPYRLIQAFLEAVYRLKVSVGELVNLSQKVEQELSGEVARIKEETRASPYVHMDETGWRENGQNGYIWCMVADTPQPVRYFEYHRSRAGVVVQSMGGDFKGVLVTDFYSAYNIYEGLHQRCWVHLLRDLAEVRKAHLENGAIVAWCVGVKNRPRLCSKHTNRLTATNILSIIFVSSINKHPNLCYYLDLRGFRNPAGRVAPPTQMKHIQ